MATRRLLAKTSLNYPHLEVSSHALPKDNKKKKPNLALAMSEEFPLECSFVHGPQRYFLLYSHTIGQLEIIFEVLQRGILVTTMDTISKHFLSIQRILCFKIKKCYKFNFGDRFRY